MELNLSEIDTMNPYDTFDYNSYQQDNGDNYWEKPKTQESQTKKKKVSFRSSSPRSRHRPRGYVR